MDAKVRRGSRGMRGGRGRLQASLRAGGSSPRCPALYTAHPGGPGRGPGLPRGTATAGGSPGRQAPLCASIRGHDARWWSLRGRQAAGGGAPRGSSTPPPVRALRCVRPQVGCFRGDADALVDRLIDACQRPEFGMMAIQGRELQRWSPDDGDAACQMFGSLEEPLTRRARLAGMSRSKGWLRAPRACAACAETARPRGACADPACGSPRI
jgi:hypothetical protein